MCKSIHRGLAWDGQEGSCRKLWWCDGSCGLRHVPCCDGMGARACAELSFLLSNIASKFVNTKSRHMNNASKYIIIKSKYMNVSSKQINIESKHMNIKSK